MQQPWENVSVKRKEKYNRRNDSKSSQRTKYERRVGSLSTRINTAAPTEKVIVHSRAPESVN